MGLKLFTHVAWAFCLIALVKSNALQKPSYMIDKKIMKEYLSDGNKCGMYDPYDQTFPVS